MRTLTLHTLVRLTLSLAVLLAALPPAAPAEAGWRSLTGVLRTDARFDDWQISPDSRYVVYTADAEASSGYQLYSVPITGTTPIKLNPPLVTGGRVQRFVVTLDSQYVIYIADQAVDNRQELYRVPISGGPAVKLSSALVAGGNVMNVKLDPDNVRVVYYADQQSNDVFEIFSVSIAGGAAVKLNGAMVSGGDVADFKIDPIANRVVYVADQEVDSRLEIYGVPIAGGTAVKLNEAGARVDLSFEINPGLQVVVFSATPSGSTSSQLYMNATAGGLLTPLNFSLAANQDVFGFRITPDGARVIYNVTTMTSTLSVQLGNLYSVLIGGGTSTQLTTTADPGYGVFGALFNITSDSQRVVYRYQRTAASATILESVGLNGAGRATLYTPTAGDSVLFKALSANAQWVVFSVVPADVNYSIAVGGGAPVGLGHGFDPIITPDSSRVLYTTNQLSGNYDLFSQQIFGGDRRNLSRVGTNAQVVDKAVSPNGQWVVFEVEHLSADTRELRVSDGLAAPPPVYLPLITR
jgi:Tol biopolymer transport system component